MTGRRFAGEFVPAAPLSVAFDGVEPPAGEILCLFSGRLDNAPSLAAALDSSGPREGGGDERLLVAAYRRWGAGLVARLRGDFALLIWDRAKGSGLLARDQLGVRPLFVSTSGRRLLFATDMRRLLELFARRPPPDRVGVAHWITATHRPGGGTLYEGVERLGPGELLVLGADGVSRRRYWQPTYREPPDLGPDELAAQARAGLELGVRRRLDRSQGTGILMSGGLDSSSLAAVAAADGIPVRSYSARFPDHPATDEAGLIAELRADLGLGGVLATVRVGGLLESALDYQALSGSPLISWGDFWIRPLLRAAANEGVGTMLDGDGGDEVFGARVNVVADRIRALRPGQVGGALRRLPGAGQVPRRQVVGLLARQGVVALPGPLHRSLEALEDRRRRPPWLRREARRGLAGSADPVPWRRLDGPLWWSQVAWTLAAGMDEAGVFEHHRNRADIAGVEAAHPMLDLDLVELCLSAPPLASLDPRFSRPLLRSAVAGILPDAVRLRPAKAHFESLIAECLSGPDEAAIRALLLDPGARVGQFVDQRRLGRGLLDGEEVERGSFRWMWLVWRTVTAELWLRGEEGTPPGAVPASGPMVEIGVD